jgi:uncharacterized SAM-binding protein YcdF (DUF218 family)
MTDDVNDMLNVKRETPESGSSGDFWTFRTMITPVLIQIIFWIGVIACVVVGGMMIKNAYNEYRERWNEAQVMLGLAWVFLGPLVVRIYCEFMILFFRMNETLTEIKNKLR